MGEGQRILMVASKNWRHLEREWGEKVPRGLHRGQHSLDSRVAGHRGLH